MSSNNRATSKGGKGPKGDKSHKMDKSESKGSADKQHSSTPGSGDTKSNEHMIKQIMEMTQRPENQVCLALHECDYDMERAIDMLLDLPAEDKWETTVKKRKNRQQSASKSEQKTENAVTTTASDDPWADATTPAGAGDKEKPRNKTSGSQRFHGRHNDSRGWRGREKQENERNMEDGSAGRDRRGRSGGSTRGGGGARGRGGGRAGGRYPARSNRGGGTFNNRPMETWDNSWDAGNSTTTTTNHTDDNWGDEWCGTLTETKVFTPSQPVESTGESEVQQSVASMDNSTASVQQNMEMLAVQMSVAPNPPVAMSGTLNAAQTQYFSQLTQQSNNNEMNKYNVQQQAPPPNYGNNNAQYGSSAPPPTNTYSGSTYSNSYPSQDNVPVHQQQPARTKVRAKIPPPSKIPSTAVEMPGDLNTNMGLLDLQFGAMDIMSDSSSFDGVADPKYQNSSILDASATSGTMDLNNQQSSATMDAYSPSKPSAQQSSISSALTQSLSNSDSIPQTSEHLSSGYSVTNVVTQRSSTAVCTNAQSNSSLDQLSKQPDSHPYSQASSYSPYQTKSTNYPNQTYNSSTNYNATQTTNSYVANQGSNSYVNSDSSSYNSNANSSYQNTYSTNTSYQSNTNNTAFPSTGGNTYPSNQSYQQNASQSVYGANAGGLNNSSYGSNSSQQYNNYNSNHKLVKDSSTGYDSGTTAASSLSTTSTSTSTPLTLTTTVTTSKTNTTLSKNSNSVVSNIPPATPVMGQYIMGQVPYYQPPMYSFEEMQMLQQRIPHMTTPFYEMSYQTPATTPREGSYSLSDGRFTRTDSNASPVSSTQTSTQPMLAAQTTGPYFFTPYNPMQPNYQFGTVYSTQLPAGTNAHGSSTTAQYPKPATYGSGYTSGYDVLSQTQDYSKGGYVGNTQGQNKGGAANATSGTNAANDLSAMYGKSHTALGKVNGFHSGTPPPFTGALGQSALAPSGTGYGPQMYIPTMAHQQHHTTPLMHQPLHQMEVRHHGRRMDSGNSTGQRAQGNNQQKAGSKQAYPNSYWNQP